MSRPVGTKALRIALVQMNPVVGDLAGNSARMLEHIRAAVRKKADIVAFPELALTGYPPEDLILKPQFITDNLNGIRRLAGRVDGITVIAGFVDRGPDGAIYNAAAVIAGKKIVDIYHKILLPNYGVFDEFRYFKPGSTYPVYSLSGTRFGVNICEDIWHHKGPTHIQALAGAEFIININASPYEQGKPGIRECILKERSSKNGVMVAYLNTVGGQDELVFDGMSMVFDRDGRMVASASQFVEDVLVVDLDIRQLKRGKKKARSLPAGYAGKVRRVRLPMVKERPSPSPVAMTLAPRLGKEEEVYSALVLGTRDYVLKNGFKGVVIGLSGGIDSSLVATIAADALGKKQVRGLFMPSVITSGESREDAFDLAERLGVSITEIPIAGIMQGYMAALEPSFRGMSPDTTEENLQARIRGNLLMACSNKFGWLVLTTGNKSEMGVGYATLYGDMAGGFAVIKDVPKVMVYELCRWRNTRGKPVIPDRVLSKEPTAELRPNQRDTDSLPPYPVLDPILRAYIEDELTFEEILAMGCDPEQAKRVIVMVDRSEYKRRQAPPGVKITRRAFGRDRRFPITNRYRSY